MTRVALVVPSNRTEQLAQFLDAWADAAWDDTVVVYDGPRADCSLELQNGVIYCWDDVEPLVGEASWIFSRRDSACRSFGFLQAVRRGADIVITLDDDCYPLTSSDVSSFVAEHRRNLEQPPAWVSSVPGMRVRGMPFADPDLVWDGPPVLVSMGLWSDVPDLSAVETLALNSALHGEHRAILTRFRPTGGTRVMSPHQFFPFCGMNFAFRREVLPALYFPLMGETSPYARFDDIWCGLLLQRMLSRTDGLITVGEPWVRHTRASDAFDNLVKEAPGIAANESYWQVLQTLPLEGNTLWDCAYSAAKSLEHSPEAFLSEWGRALGVWLSLCGEETVPGVTIARMT